MDDIRDPWTGKRVDKLSDLLPSEGASLCEECGTRLINRCLRCGAPVCCPKCCAQDEVEEELSDGK
jgi:hypothetical protein